MSTQVNLSSTSGVILVQCDWLEALSEENGKAWITFKKRGENGRHSFLKNPDGGDLRGIRPTTDDFRLMRINPRSFEVLHSESEITFKVIYPVETFSNIHAKTLSCMDVSVGGLGISSENNKILVWETESGTVRRSLEGHLGDIYTCQLFPSGVVVLSGGTDLRIRIWSAEDGSCPRTLVGHRGPIVATAIVEKGMNIVGVSKDGGVILWSCGLNRLIEPEIRLEENPTCCHLFSNEGHQVMNGNGHSGDPDGTVDEAEVGTDGKLLVVGGENGILFVVDLKGRKVLRQVALQSPIQCVTSTAGRSVIAGCENGAIVILGIDDLKISGQIHDSDSPVTSVMTLANGFLAGKQDGSCIFYNSSSNQRVVLSGADVDPIFSIAKDERFIYTGARDGKIRKYSIDNILY